jgi:hypothetical protein
MYLIQAKTPVFMESKLFLPSLSEPLKNFLEFDYVLQAWNAFSKESLIPLNDDANTHKKGKQIFSNSWPQDHLSFMSLVGQMK